MATSVAPRIPMYHPGAPGLGQQFLYGQAPPAIIPPQVITYLLIIRVSISVLAIVRL